MRVFALHIQEAERAVDIGARCELAAGQDHRVVGVHGAVAVQAERPLSDGGEPGIGHSSGELPLDLDTQETCGLLKQKPAMGLLPFPAS